MKNSKNKKRIWNTEELTIAYYIAKWGIHGLGIEAEDLVESVIKDTTIQSLNMQVSNFRFILDIPGNKLEHSGVTKIKLAEELSNVTYSNVKKTVLELIDAASVRIEKSQITKNNKQAMLKRDELNKKSRENHQNKMIEMSKHRRLRPLNQ